MATVVCSLEVYIGNIERNTFAHHAFVKNGYLTL